MTCADLTGWKHIVMNLHMGGKGLILTSLLSPHLTDTYFSGDFVTEQPFLGRALLTQSTGRMLEKVHQKLTVNTSWLAGCG